MIALNGMSIENTNKGKINALNLVFIRQRAHPPSEENRTMPDKPIITIPVVFAKLLR
jgi:hypothetical protein